MSTHDTTSHNRMWWVSKWQHDTVWVSVRVLESQINTSTYHILSLLSSVLFRYRSVGRRLQRTVCPNIRIWRHYRVNYLHRRHVVGCFVALPACLVALLGRQSVSWNSAPSLVCVWILTPWEDFIGSSQMGHLYCHWWSKTVQFLELYYCCWVNVVARFPCVVIAGVSEYPSHLIRYLRLVVGPSQSRIFLTTNSFVHLHFPAWIINPLLVKNLYTVQVMTYTYISTHFLRLIVCSGAYSFLSSNVEHFSLDDTDLHVCQRLHTNVSVHSYIRTSVLNNTFFNFWHFSLPNFNKIYAYWKFGIFDRHPSLEIRKIRFLKFCEIFKSPNFIETHWKFSKSGNNNQTQKSHWFPNFFCVL